MPRKERLPENVTSYLDRHGRRRYRFRKTGLPARTFKHHPNTKEGRAELAEFKAGKRPVAAERYAHGTVGWLAAIYRTSLAFRSGKNVETERNAWSILERFVSEYARDRVEHFRFDHIEAILQKAARPRIEKKRRRGGPHAALNLRGELLPFFNFAIKHSLIATNPVELADAPEAPRSTGFHTWTEDEIARYRACHPLGTKARLALEIFLWTALRRGDASTFGRSHLSAGRIAVSTSKTGETIWLPAAPQLLEAIEAMAVTGRTTFLVTDYGEPFSRAGLGNKMRQWCDEAGLPHCTAHGLRKAAARRAAEHGGSNAELKALGGWRTDAQVAVYTAAADRQRLADQALAPVIAADLANRERTK
jgi:integrase